MIECVDQNWSFIVDNWNIFSSVLAFLCGGAGGFFLHVFIKKDNSSVKNKKIIVGGDFVGRDRY